MTSEKKLKKFYLASSSFSWAISDFLEVGQLVENYIISLKDYNFFWRDAYKHEVDFIDVDNKFIIPIESKYKEEIGNKDLAAMFIFAKKFGVNEIRLFTKTLEQKKYYLRNIQVQEDPVFLSKKIFFKPLDIFFLF